MQSCPKCGASVAETEKFCAACGAGVAQGVLQDPPPPRAADLRVSIDHGAAVGKARKWLLAVSIITAITGTVLYFIGKDNVEDQIRTAEQQTAGISPELRDQITKDKTGMTWEEAKAHDRGQVTMLLVINLGLAAAFFGLWIWAKKNALGASITALILFVTVTVMNMVFDPKTIAQGIIVKIFFTLALIRAIKAAQEERRFA